MGWREGGRRVSVMEGGRRMDGGMEGGGRVEKLQLEM